MPVIRGKYRNPTILDLIKHARTRVVGSDASSHTICLLADEVIRLRNAAPCSRCKGTGRMETGDMYMGGPLTYDVCDQCKGHPGKKYKRMKRIP